MRVAVTGASGFIGGWIARVLAERGDTVFSYGRRAPAALRSPLPNYTTWDVTGGGISAPAVDAVVHCAAHVGHWGDEDEYHAINVGGMRCVLDAFSEVMLFVHVSTSSVYDPAYAHRDMNEETPTVVRGSTAYARTKAEGERVLAASGRRYVTLRPHIVYGAGDTTLLPRLLAARHLGRLPVPGNGRNRLSVTHVFNLVHAVERTLCTPDAAGAFNVADAVTPTVDELLRSTLALTGLPPRLLYLPRPVAWGAAWASEHLAQLLHVQREPVLTRYVVAHLTGEHTLDVSRARRVLGYEPRWTYRDLLARSPLVPRAVDEVENEEDGARHADRDLG